MGAFSKPSSYTPLPDNAPAVVLYPNSSGVTTTGAGANYVDPYSKSSDPYGGQPINISVGNSASGLQSIAGSLGAGFEGLFDLLQKNTDKNNVWSAAQADKQMAFQERMNSLAMEFNSLEAGKNRDWQQMMSNTAHQREVADLKAAGLNPILSASGGNGAAVTSGATASAAGVPSGARADPDQSMNGALASLYGALISAQTQMYNANLSARTNLQMAEMQKEASMYGAQLAANANMYGSQMAYNASTYGADMNFRNSEAQREFNALHPDNLYQAATSTPIQNAIDYAYNKVKSLLGIGSGSVSAKSKSTHR